MVLASAGITVQILHTFTLEATGVLNNPGTLQVGAFVNNGRTIIGNNPNVIGLPPATFRILGLSVKPSALPPAPLVSQEIRLIWEYATPAKFTVQSRTDLVHWQEQAATIQQISATSYQATLDLAGAPSRCYFRVSVQNTP